MSLGWNFVLVDISTAFLYARMKRILYIKVPQYYPRKVDPKRTALLCQGAIYGTPDGPKNWADELGETLKKLGYVRCHSDWNLFEKKSGTGPVSYIAFHVDDGLISASTQQLLDEILKSLQNRYKLKIDYEVTRYLKLRFTKTKEFVYLDYIEECARKFKVTDARPLQVPMDPGFVSKILDSDKLLATSTPYRELMGSLLYISRQTRPDVVYAVNLLCQHLHQPTERMWEAAKKVLIYLNSTKHFSLRVGPTNDSGLVAFSDSTWADDTHTRTSRSGGVIFYNGSYVSSYSHPQRSVSLSLTQAEYQALASAVQEILFFRQLLGELGHEQKPPSTLHCDNQGTLYLVVSTKNHPKIKHIAIKFHFIRQAVQEKQVTVHYVPTQDQVADVFTKPLPGSSFKKFRYSIGVNVWGGVTRLSSTPLGKNTSLKLIMLTSFIFNLHSHDNS